MTTGDGFAAENLRDAFENKSLKWRLMAELTRSDAWGDTQVRANHDAMVTVLRNDVFRIGLGDAGQEGPPIGGHQSME